MSNGEAERKIRTKCIEAEKIHLNTSGKDICKGWLGEFNTHTG